MSGLNQAQAPWMDNAATEVTHGNDAQPKEDSREDHNQVDLPSSGRLLPLYIARDDKEGDKQACHGIWSSAYLVFQGHLRVRTN